MKCNACLIKIAKNRLAVQCKFCKQYFHTKCKNIDRITYNKVKEDSHIWFCRPCNREFTPFADLNDELLRLTLQDNDNFNFNLINDNQMFEITQVKQQLYQKLNSIGVNNENNNECLYYTASELNDIKSHKNSLSIMHLNISSLPFHYDDLTSLLSVIENKFDLIGITETKLQKDIPPKNCIDLQNYNIEQCTTESSKGGALLYISDKYNYKRRDDLTLYKKLDLESTFVEILNQKGKNIVVGVIYKHPKMGINEFIGQYLYKLFDITSNENKHLILLGDFNINLLNFKKDNDTGSFIDTMTSNSLQPLILRPTRITTKSNTLIDNIFTNITSENVTSGNITHTISDHLAQFAFIEMNIKKKVENNLFRRDFKHFNNTNFKEDILKVDWEKELHKEIEDPNHSIEKLISIVNKKLDKHAPYKMFSQKSKEAPKRPWMTKGILKSISKRDNIHKKYVRSKNEVNKVALYENYRR